MRRGEQRQWGPSNAGNLSELQPGSQVGKGVGVLPGDGRGEAGISCCPSSTVLSFTGAPAVQWWRQSLTGGVVARGGVGGGGSWRQWSYKPATG